MSAIFWNDCFSLELFSRILHINSESFRGHPGGLPRCSGWASCSSKLRFLRMRNYEIMIRRFSRIQYRDYKVIWMHRRPISAPTFFGVQQNCCLIDFLWLLETEHLILGVNMFLEIFAPKDPLQLLIFVICYHRSENKVRPVLKRFVKNFCISTELIK